jgi:hypothetical protein
VAGLAVDAVPGYCPDAFDGIHGAW